MGIFLTRGLMSLGIKHFNNPNALILCSGKGTLSFLLNCTLSLHPWRNRWTPCRTVYRNGPVLASVTVLKVWREQEMSPLAETGRHHSLCAKWDPGRNTTLGENRELGIRSVSSTAPAVISCFGGIATDIDNINTEGAGEPSGLSLYLFSKVTSKQKV